MNRAILPVLWRTPGWAALEQAHDQAASRYDWDAARAETQRLESYAQALSQDPQMEDVLRTRGAEFGVEKGSRLERGRGRDHGPGPGDVMHGRCGSRTGG